MKKQLERFWREEDGITALEYGILAAIILVAVAAFAIFIKDQFGPDGAVGGGVCNSLKKVATASSASAPDCSQL